MGRYSAASRVTYPTTVHLEGLNDTAGTFGMNLTATLTEVQVPTHGTTSSGDRVPIHLQGHGNIEDLGEDLPPHFTFLDDAFRSVVRRDYDLAVFLGATAAEAFVSALLTDRLSDASNKEAIYELVSRASAEQRSAACCPYPLANSYRRISPEATERKWARSGTSSPTASAQALPW
jgi:hypothetical protein